VKARATGREFSLAATISTGNVPQVQEALRGLIVAGSVQRTADGFAVTHHSRLLRDEFPG
jgi:hypothetical protein